MSKRILIIDDDQLVRTMAEDYLKEAGYNVVTAECPVYSNHEIYSKSPPDLILMDVMMPLMSGIKKSQLLKSREKSRHIPIVLISSKDDNELKSLKDEAMADDYLSKPFCKDRLINTTRKLTGSALDH